MNKQIWRDHSRAPEERAAALMEELTIEEKLGQLTGVLFFSGHEEEMHGYLKNGVGQVGTLDFRNMKTGQDAAAWQRKLQKLVMDSNRHGIPAVFHMEGLCGPVMEGGISFPSGMARGASFDLETEEKIAQIVSRQELACGLTQVLAPVLDIARDPRMGRYAEPYSEDAVLSAQMGTAYTKGIQEYECKGRHAESVAKHFLGFHLSQGGIHGADVEAGTPLIREQFAKPFEAAIRKAGLKGIMPCYCSENGLPVHASEELLTELLRGELGFQGVVVSDYSGVSNTHNVQNIGETLADAGYLCLKAGTDVELPLPSAYSAELAEMFESGEADINILNQAVMRVLTAKFRMGIFEHPFALEGDEFAHTYTNPDDRKVSLQSARESLVLLKNNGVLPLSGKKEKIALIGPQGKNARFFFGGYTLMSMAELTRSRLNSLAGTGGGGSASEVEMLRIPGTNVESDNTEVFEDLLPWLYPECSSLYDELIRRLPDTEITYACGYPVFGEDQSGFSEALCAAEQADLVILMLGGKYSAGSIATMGEGIDGTDINLPACQDAFIQAVKKLGKPLVGIHLDGRPISSDIADENLDAILECWTPGECGSEAIVDVLTGTVNPSGKLPCTVARNAGQLPIWYNHLRGSSWHQGPSIGFADYVDLPHTPRYPFGFGCSYTSFDYKDLQMSSTEIGPEDSLTISMKIKNTGNCHGTEIVQMYLQDIFASRMRPVKELAGFIRVDLEPGEEKTVEFSTAASQTAFYTGNDRWMVEKGDVFVMIGASSEDIRLKGTFRIAESLFIKGRDRALWSDPDFA